MTEINEAMFSLTHPIINYIKKIYSWRYVSVFMSYSSYLVY